MCKPCRLADKLRRRLEDPAGHRAIRRAYYAANIERERARGRKFSRTPAGRAIQRRAYRKHRESNLARGRAWYAANRNHALAVAREWKRRNPDNTRWHTRLRRARRLQVAGSHSEREWRALRRRFQGRCAYCGIRPGLHRDHVLPLSRGGSDYASNLLPACQYCNSSKHDKLLAYWRYRRNGAAHLEAHIRARPKAPLP
ncbi:HNH endonuclease [Allorhizocola rhizosphaerae]|uniref:HNH endonuclease n=1 Tax=Allorhizocola rhizosphaerae TaxID=1872709 RepID=UPI0013C36E12|nr:HNH endonuclease signature motif containing protein [Allorhizocola rhizosphaerae]